MKNKKILIMVAVILMIVVIGVIGFTFAKYQSIGESNINPKVAKWHVLVNDIDISDGKTKTFEANINWNQNDNIYNNGKTLIAPGSKGVVSFDIDARESQVSVKYNIKLDTSKLKDHKQIKITKITSTQDEKETIINETEEFNGLINLEEINKPVTIKVYIEWDPDISDDDDYNLGTNDIPLSIGVEVTISQKVNNTLAETIIKNAKEHKNEDSTIYKEEPETTPAQEISKEDERTLSMTGDDYGNSYYFRGNVIDNYLNFNNMCWRIVRIEGDGSVKLILYDSTKTCETATGGENALIKDVTAGFNITIHNGTNYYEFDYENCTTDTDTCINHKLNKWLNQYFDEKNQKQIKEDNWLIYNNSIYYDYKGNIVNDIFQSQNGYRYTEEGYRVSIQKKALLNYSEKAHFYKNKIGVLNVDEALFSGMSDSKCTTNSFLSSINQVVLPLNSITLYNGNYRDVIYYLSCKVFLSEVHYGSNYGTEDEKTKRYGISPSIVLIPNIELLSGDGTKENPYQID